MLPQIQEGGSIKRMLDMLTCQGSSRKPEDQLPLITPEKVQKHVAEAAKAKEELQSKGEAVLQLPSNLEAWDLFETAIASNLINVCTDPQTGDHVFYLEDEVNLNPSNASLLQLILDDPTLAKFFPSKGHAIIMGPIREGCSATLADVGAFIVDMSQYWEGSNQRLGGQIPGRIRPPA